MLAFHFVHVQREKTMKHTITRAALAALFAIPLALNRVNA